IENFNFDCGRCIMDMGSELGYRHPRVRINMVEGGQHSRMKIVRQLMVGLLWGPLATHGSKEGYRHLGKVENSNRGELSYAYKLDNGMEVVLVSGNVFNINSTAIALHIRNSKKEASDFVGIGKFCAALIRCQLGLTDARVVREYGMVASTLFRVDLERKYTSRGLNRLAAVLSKPSFDSPQNMTKIARELTETPEAVEYVLVRALRSESNQYHPLRQLVDLGWVENPKLEAIKAYFRRNYVPANMRLVVVSRIKVRRQLIKTISKAFKKIQPGRKTEPLTPPLSPAHKGKHIKLRSEQSFAYLQFQVDKIQEAHQLLYLLNSPYKGFFKDTLNRLYNYTVRASLQTVSQNYALLNVMLKPQKEKPIHRPYYMARAVFQYFRFLKKNINLMEYKHVYPAKLLGGGKYEDPASITADSSLCSLFRPIKLAFQAYVLPDTLDRPKFSSLLKSLDPKFARVVITTNKKFTSGVKTSRNYAVNYAISNINVMYLKKDFTKTFAKTLPSSLKKDKNLFARTYYDQHFRQEMIDVRDNAMGF
ncbi:hypothetical protein L0F63_002267, partial [Massospora cicadina]